MLIERSVASTVVLLSMVAFAIAQPVKKEEALKFAHYIETETDKGNPGPLDHFLDMDKIVGNMKSPMMQNEAFRTGFRQGFASSMKGYGVKIVNNVKAGNYKLLRAFEKNGEQHLLFRMYGVGGLNYHDYTLTRVNDSIKAADCFVYLTDETLSSTMSKLVDMMGIDPNNPEASGDIESLKQLSALRNQGDYAGAKSYYDKLDNRVKMAKGVLVVYLSICHHLSDSLYQVMLERYVGMYPNVSSGYMMMMDLYFMKKESDKGVAAANKLDSLVGGDPLLNFYRGAFYELGGKKEQSLVCYEKAYQYDHAIVVNTKALIAAYAEARQKEKALAVISEYKKLPAFRQEDLDALYAGYPNLK